MIGKRFHRWLVLARGAKPDGQRKPHIKWLCRCDCGAEREVYHSHLKSGESRSCGCLRHENCGGRHHNWRGGRHIGVDGYVRVTAGSGRRHEHRVVMERLLGRPLRQHEAVHHKNGRKDDNCPDNLELCVDRHPPKQRVSDLQMWAIRLLNDYPVIVGIPDGA